MYSVLRRACALALSVVWCVLLASCQPVREDRTITWSAQGDAVGFQHGGEGVFVADKHGSGLKKIFQPAAEVLATSPPLWSPQGKRLLFTTARDANGAPFSNQQREQDPAGNLHFPQPVLYTCWLREEEQEGMETAPTKVFEAACDHVGYVAGNLAVRWHPQGDRVLYLKQTEPHRHGLYEYDLQTGDSRQVFPRTSEALIFDWTADNSHLVCVLGSLQQPGKDNGIWIGKPGLSEWWHVPGSETLAQGVLPSLLEVLRASRPAFTKDTSRFAFASFVPEPDSKQPGRHLLQLGNLTTRTVELLAESPHSFSDLRWSPDGLQLGMVNGLDLPALHLMRPGDGLHQLIDPRPVRRFAGWNHSGKQLAYVVPEQGPLARNEQWVFLLVPDPLARDTVYLAEGETGKQEREVFSGMRVTFPQWSPTEDKLSVWFTFTPSHQSVASRALGFLLSNYVNVRLRPGDPAAILDVKTGQVRWLAVNAQEKAQVGHYYLLKRDYAAAWQWYADAERQAAGQQPAASGLVDFARQLDAPNDFSFFEFYCLTKLGRKEEARARLEQFHRKFAQPLPTEKEDPVLGALVDGRTLRERLQAITEPLLDPKNLSGTLLRQLCMAEVFLSVDAVEDGEQFFRQALDAAQTDPERLSSALVLSQFLLLQRKHALYAELATNVIAPLLGQMYRQPLDQAWKEQLNPASWQQLTLLLAGGPALMPMLAPDFLASLPDEQVHAVVRRCKELEATAPDDVSRQVIDLALYAAYQRLRREAERQAVAERFVKEHKGSVEMLDAKHLRKILQEALNNMNVVSFPR